MFCQTMVPAPCKLNTNQCGRLHLNNKALKSLWELCFFYNHVKSVGVSNILHTYTNDLILVVQNHLPKSARVEDEILTKSVFSL